MIANKKVIILWHNGGRLANQLWLFMSVYAYCLEKGYNLENHSFFEFAQDFNIKSGNFWIDALFFKSFVWLKKILPRYFYRDQHDYFFRTYYKIYVKIIELLKRKNIIYAKVVEYLPPTRNNSHLLDFENDKKEKVYLSGWLFRNPVGLEKYRSKITEYFNPKGEIYQKASLFVNDLRSRYDTVVGVHLRQGDYKKYQEYKELSFSEDNIRFFLNEYLKQFNKDKSRTTFIICSDGPVDSAALKEFNVTVSNSNAVEDLFILSLTDIIIGSDSTFGALASYYGNIPMIVMKKEGIDWDYYKDKKAYFENKYLTTVHY